MHYLPLANWTRKHGKLFTELVFCGGNIRFTLLSSSAGLQHVQLPLYKEICFFSPLSPYFYSPLSPRLANITSWGWRSCRYLRPCQRMIEKGLGAELLWSTSATSTPSITFVFDSFESPDLKGGLLPMLCLCMLKQAGSGTRQPGVE